MIQLKGYLEQLRSLVPPEPGKVQSIDGEGFTDGRAGPEQWGPFESHDEFNKFFLHDKVRNRPNRYPRTQAPLAVTKGRTWRTVFAHGDLGPLGYEERGDCCSHRLGIFRVVSRVLGIYKSIFWTCCISELRLVGDVQGVHSMLSGRVRRRDHSF